MPKTVMMRKVSSEAGKEEERERGFGLREALKLLKEKREEVADSSPKERYQGAFSDLPSSVRDNIEVKLYVELEDMLEKGVINKKQKDEYLATRAEQEARVFESTYLDKRFLTGNGKELRVPKDEYAKADILDDIDRLIETNPGAEDLRKIARLSFDANGLKAANDLSGSHEKGTEFLRRIAEVFAREDGSTRVWLKEKGVTKILATTGGGDEYGVILVSDKEPISPELLAEAVSRFESEVAAVDVSDIVDFKDPEVLMRFGGISEAESARMGSEAKEAKLKELRAAIPEGAIFKASISGGGATLAEGFERAISADGDRRISKTDSYRRVLQKIMGAIWDVADEDALDSKNEYKSLLRESADPVKRFESQLLARTAESRALEAKLAEQAQELTAKTGALEDLLLMVQAMETGGISPRDLRKTLESKLRMALGTEEEKLLN